MEEEPLSTMHLSSSDTMSDSSSESDISLKVRVLPDLESVNIKTDTSDTASRRMIVSRFRSRIFLLSNGCTTIIFHSYCVCINYNLMFDQCFQICARIILSHGRCHFWWKLNFDHIGRRSISTPGAHIW